MTGVRITRIESQNYKKDDHDIALPPGLVVVGRNYIGKTAIGEATEIPFTGVITGGRYNQASLIHADFARDNNPKIDIRTKVTLSDGTSLERVIGPRNGKVTQEIFFRGEEFGRDKAAKEIEAALNPRVITLDMKKFIEESDDKKIKYLLGFVNVPEEYGRDPVYNRLRAFLLTKDMPAIFPNVLTGEEVSADLRGKAADGLLGHIFVVWPNTLDPVTGLLKLNEKLRTTRNRLEKERKKAKAVQETLDDLRDEVHRHDNDAADIQRKIDGKEKEKTDLTAKIATSEQVTKGRETWVENEEKYDTELNESKANLELGRTSGFTFDRNTGVYDLGHGMNVDFESQHQEIENEAVDPDALAEAQVKVEKLEEQKPDLMKARQEAIDAESVARAKLDGLMTYRDVITTREMKCPKCAHQWKPTVEGLEDEINEQSMELRRCQKATLDARKAASDNEADHKTNYDALLELEKKQDAAYEKRKKVEAAEEVYKGGLAYFEQLVTERQRRVDDHKKQKPKPAPVTKDQDSLDTVEEELTKLREDHTAKIEEKKQYELRIEAEMARLETDEAIKVYDALKEEAGSDGVLGEALVASVSPMLEKINRYLIEGDEAHIDIDEDNRLRVGMKVGGQFRSINSMSRSQLAEFAAALSIVFAEGHGLVYLFADNLDSFDEVRIVSFLDAMSRALEDGAVDTFIGCSARHIGEDSSGAVLSDVGGIAIMEFEDVMK